RGRGFLLGVELVDPRDGVSFLPIEMDVAGIVDDTAFDNGLLVTSTHPQADGFAGDQTLLAPAYTSTDEELAEMVERFAATIADAEPSGIRTGAADLVVRPDTTALYEVTWRPGWRVGLATPSWPDGSPCDLAAREVYRRVVDDVAELGYEVRAALEYEIRLWDGDGQPLSSGISYSLAEIGRYRELVDRLAPALAAMGIELSAVHTEAGPGLLELNLAPGGGIDAADQACLLKFAVKDLAATLGLRASFLAKTNPGEEGSSGH